MKTQEDKNRRRFQRVIVKDLSGELDGLIGAKVLWGSQQLLSVFDMSLSGLAFSAPPEETLQSGQEVHFHIQFPGQKSVRVSAEVVWVSPKIVGVHFEPLEVASRMAIAHYLDDKVIGSNLHLIDKQYHGPTLKSDVWYQGPSDTNVYLWIENGRIVKAQVELEEDVLVFENGEVRETPVKGLFQRVVDILSQTDPENTSLKQLLSDLINVKNNSSVTSN